MSYTSIAVLSLSFLALAVTQNERNSNKKNVVCYYANWAPTRADRAMFTPQTIDPFLCTHLIYAFATFEEGRLVAGSQEQDIDKNGFVDFNDLKSINEQLKTMLSIGGWVEGSTRFSRIASSKDRIDKFAQSAVDLLRQYDFDGINIDWQYPTFRDNSRVEDRENFVELVKSLRESFENEAKLSLRPRMLVTMTLPAEKEYIEKGYDLINLQKYIDFFSIVSYDYHLAVEPNVYHHAPLYPLPSEIEENINVELNADSTVDYLLSKGIMREKLNLGIPTYGRTFKLENKDENQFGSPSKGQGDAGKTNIEVGYIPYYEICKKIIDEKWTVVQVNESALGPYAYRGEDWVAYDDEKIARTKAEYVRQKGLAGVMFWTIDNDDFRGDCGTKSFPVIKAARAGLSKIRSRSGIDPNTIPSPRPTKADTTPTTSVAPPTKAAPARRKPTPIPTKSAPTLNVKIPLTESITRQQDTIPTSPSRRRFFVNATFPPPEEPIKIYRTKSNSNGDSYFQTISIWIQNNIISFN